MARELYSNAAILTPPIEMPSVFELSLAVWYKPITGAAPAEPSFRFGDPTVPNPLKANPTGPFIFTVSVEVLGLSTEATRFQ